jgi:hypothetical protein
MSLVHSIDWLLNDLRQNGGAEADMLLGALKKTKRTDCGCTISQRRCSVKFQGMRWNLARLVYYLCAPTRDFTAIGPLYSQCSAPCGMRCIEPQHVVCAMPTKPPRRNLFGNTLMTELILRRHYPDFARARGKRHALYLRTVAKVLGKHGAETDELCKTYKRPKIELSEIAAKFAALAEPATREIIAAASIKV